MENLPAEYQGLARVREQRGRGERDLSLSHAMRKELTGLRSMKRAMSGVARAWEEVVPRELAERTRLVGVKSGVLTVAVEDSSTRYELGRLMRAGNEARLARLCPVGVRKVKVVVMAGEGE